MLGRKKQTKTSLDFSDLFVNIMEELEKESEISKRPSFYPVSIGDPDKWDSNPGTLGLTVSDVANKQNQSNHYHTHNN